MDRMTMIIIIVALVIVGLVIFISVKGKADAQKAKQMQIAQLIDYKKSHESNETKKKTSWLDGITGVVALASNIIAPGTGGAVSGAGSQIGKVI